MGEFYCRIWEGLPKTKFVSLFVVAKDQSLIRSISSEQNSSKVMAEKEIDFLQKPTELNGLSVIW